MRSVDTRFLMAESVPEGADPKLIKSITKFVLDTLDQIAQAPSLLSSLRDRAFTSNSLNKSFDVNGGPLTFISEVRFETAPHDLPTAVYGSAAWTQSDEQTEKLGADGKLWVTVYVNPVQWKMSGQDKGVRDSLKKQIVTTLDHETGHLQRIIATGKKGLNRQLPVAYLAPSMQASRGVREPHSGVQYGRNPSEWDAHMTALVAGWKRLPKRVRAKLSTVVELIDRVYGSSYKAQGLRVTLGMKSPEWQKKTLSRLNREGIPIRSWGMTWDESVQEVKAGNHICAWCGKDMGSVDWLRAGETTHGLCPECKDKLQAELDEPELKPVDIRIQKKPAGPNIESAGNPVDIRYSDAVYSSIARGA